MANNHKFKVKNGLQTQNISFVDSSGTDTITASMLGTDTLSFSGNAGQLFSLTDSLSGTIFSVNDVSGIPSIEVDDNGTIRFAEFSGNILLGTDTDDETSKLQVDGNISFSADLKTGSTTVIDSTRVLTNLNGAIKSDSNFAFLTVANSAQNIRTKSVFAGTSYSDTPPAGSFNATNTYELNGTTVIDSSRQIFAKTGTQVGEDGTYAGYGVIGFGGITNGYNRVFGRDDNGDGLFLASASNRGVIIRTNGSSADTFAFTATGNFQVAGTTVLDSSRNLTAGNITTTGYLRGPASFVIDPAAHGNDTGTVVIAGNLQIDGTTTTINSTTLTVDDKNITLASGSTNAAAANGAGITVDCGSDTDTTFTFNGTSAQWNMNTELNIQPRHTGGTPPSLHLGDLNNQYQSGIASSGHLTMRAGGSGNLYWQNSGTYLMMMTNAGDLSIGNGTSAPTNHRLHIKTAVDNSVAQGLVIERSVNTDRGYINYNAGGFQFRSTVGDPIVFGETDAEHMRILPDGNVGIGTTTPDEFGLGGSFRILSVGGDNPGILNLVDDGTNGSYLQFGNAAGLRRASIHAENGSDLAFTLNSSNTGTSLTERLRIKASTGNVGIGTTNPQQKFHIQGGGARIENAATGLGGFVSVGNGTEAAGNYSAYFFGNTAQDGTYFKGGIAYETLSTTNGRGDMHFLQNSAANGGNATIANSVMTILNSGNVGIGATSPQRKLTVVGAADSAGDNSGIIQLNVGTGANTDAKMTFGIMSNNAGYIHVVKPGTSVSPLILNPTGAADGKVGIGTTAPSTPFHVKGAAIDNESLAFIENTYAAGGVFFPALKAVNKLSNHSYGIVAEFRTEAGNGTDRPALLFSNGHTATNWQVGQGVYSANDNFAIGSRTAHPNSAGVWSTARFVIDTSGNVGIGTTAPNVNLNLRRETNGNIFAINRVASATHALYVGISGNDTSFYANNGIYKLGINNPLGTGGEIPFITMSPTNRYTTFTAGNVGIGTTAPSEKLHIHGGGIYTTPVTYAGNQDHWALKIGASNNAGWDFAGIKLRVNSTGNPRMSLMGVGQVEAVSIVGGNVGIGTNAPMTKLHVFDSDGSYPDDANNHLVVESSSHSYIGIGGGTSSDVGIHFGDNGGISRGRLAYLNGSDAMAFSTNGTEQMRIDASGNVGIGASLPQKPLEVVVPANDVASIGVRTLSTGQFAGVHFGYRENNNVYRKSAIVFERTDLTSGNAQGKVHILNGPQTGNGNATLSDSALTIRENGSVVLPKSSLEFVNGSHTITASMLSTDTLSFSGDAGQIFSLTDSLSGTIFSVNDVSGIPSIEVDDDGEVRIAEFSGNVGIGNGSPSQKLDVTGNIAASGTVTATGGNSTNWNTAYGWGNHASAGYTSNVGDITGVTAGTGMTGGGTTGTPTLNVIGGDGITANADNITVDSTVFRNNSAQYLQFNTASTEALTFKNSTSGGLIQVGFQQNDTDGMHHRLYLKAWKGSTTASGNVDLIVRGPSGSLTSDVLSLRSGNASPTWRGQAIWNAGNDGSGSGLDADTLDGQHGSYYAPASHVHSYLPLAGGTMTGKISMFQTNDIFGLSGTIANYPRLSFYSSEGTHAAKTQTLSGDLIGQIDFNPHTGSSYTGGGKISFISTEAITSSQRGTEARIYSTKTGQSSLSYHQFKDDDLYIKNVGGATHKYWHAGNDGSTSGLDADLLDGQEGSYYARKVYWPDVTTRLGLTVHSLTNLNTQALWSQPAGYQTMIRASQSNGLPTSHGQSYFGYTVTSRRDGGGGYSALLTSYDNSNMYFTYQQNNTAYPTWRKIWHDSNDGSGSGLDADLLDGQHGSYYAPASHNHSGVYLPIGNKAADSELLDGIDSTGFVKQLADGTSPDYQTPSSRRVDPTTSNPTNAHHAISTFGNGGNVTGQLATHFQSGQAYTRGYNSSWSAWRTQWDSVNDGSGSGLDADLLDGQEGSYYYSAANPPPTYSKYLRSDTSDTMSGNLSLHGNLLLTGDPTTTNADRTIDFTGFDKEGVTDFSDRAYIQHTNNTGGHGGAVLVISSQNDSGDGIAFLTNGSSQLKHNSNTIWTAGNDGSGSGLDADLLDGQNGSYYAPASHVHNYLPLSGGTLTGNLGGTTASFSGKVDFQGDAAVEGGSGYGVFKGYTGNNNHFIVIRGSVANQSGLSITGAHQTTFVEHAENNDTSGWYFKSNQTGSYAEIARITRTGGMHLQGSKVWHAGNDGSGSGLDADLLDGLQLHTARNNEANKVVRTDVNGYIQAGWINTTSGTTTGTNRIYASNDGYIRYVTPTTFRTNLGLWWSGNDGSGSGLDADTLDGYHKSDINPAHSHYRWTDISASNTQARRFVIMRLYGCPAHWDSSWQDIHLKVWSESYEATNLKYEICGDYAGAGTQASMFKLRLKDAGGSSEHSKFRLVLGTPVDAGWDHAGQDTYYVDVYAEASHYMNFTVAADFYSAGFNVNTLPTSGGATTVVYSSPTVSNITTFTEAKEHSYFANHKIWNDGNHGSASGLDADLLDGQHGSYYYSAANPPPGDITGVTAGTGMTGGGTSGAVTLNVIGGSGITANADNITVDSTVVRTTGTQTIGGIKVSAIANDQNYIVFSGTTGDSNGSYNHTFIGERIHSGTESSELVLAKYNDVEGTSGSDRIRHIANNHVFDTYTGATSAGANASLSTAVGAGTLYTRMTIRQNGDIEVGGSKFIDSSRNLSNIGTISSGVITATGGNSTEWNTAHGWGNHASAGYLTSHQSITGKLDKAGDTMTGNLQFSNSGTAKRGIQGTCGDNDFWFFGGGATASNAGYLEIAAGDDGSSSGSYEPIYVRQYLGAPLTGTVQRTLTLLDNSGNTAIPNQLTVGNTLTAPSYKVAAGGASLTRDPGNTTGSMWISLSVADKSFAVSDGNVARLLISGTVNGVANSGTIQSRRQHIFDPHLASTSDATATIISKGSVDTTTGYQPQNWHMAFQDGGGTVRGKITSSHYSTQYSTSSDYRLKEDIQPIANATARLLAIEAVNFRWIDGQQRSDGFIAHELQEHLPEAVTGTKDATEEVTETVIAEDGTESEVTRTIPALQGVDQSKLVPLLVKTIQELEARITALENA